MREIIASGDKKVTSKTGTEVHVNHTISKDDKTHLHIIDISSSHNGIYHNHRLTVGSVDDGKRPNVSLDDLQKTLDEYRQKVADEVDWKSGIASLVRQLK